MLGLNEKIERSLLKIFLSVLGLILLLGAVGYFGSSAFHAWQVRRLLAEANTLINEGDYKHASLDAQHMLELSPENADATRVIARPAESAGLRRAIEFWRRVLLANSADFSRAAKFLDLGEKADLLPEEKKLVEKAQLTVARR